LLLPDADALFGRDVERIVGLMSNALYQASMLRSGA
jgi:hypothetical protein